MVVTCCVKWLMENGLECDVVVVFAGPSSEEEDTPSRSSSKQTGKSTEVYV